MGGCNGKSVNLNRHLTNCHCFLSKADRAAVMDKHKELTVLQRKSKCTKPKTSPRKVKTKARYPTHRCSVCDKVVKRLDVHIVKTHLAKRRSEEYVKILRSSQIVSDEDEENKVTVPVTSGEVKVTVCDGIKDFLEHFQEHMRLYTPLVQGPMSAEIRMMRNLLHHAVGDEYVSTLSGATVCHHMANMDDPRGGFLQRKMISCTSNYARKHVAACMRAVEFMGNTKMKLYRITTEEKQDIERRLKSINCEYWRIWCMYILAMVCVGNSVPLMGYFLSKQTGTGKMRKWRLFNSARKRKRRTLI